MAWRGPLAPRMASASCPGPRGHTGAPTRHTWARGACGHLVLSKLNFVPALTLCKVR